LKIKRTPLDDVFSKLVRLRVNYTCENCGKRGGLHDCAHIIPRRSTATRWHPLNAVDLCRGCHLYFTSRPFEWVDWCNEKFGEEFIDELRLVANKPVKWTPADRKDILKHYQGEFERVKPLRDSGVVARIDFAAHDVMYDFSS
jgi:hypothetical protein